MKERSISELIRRNRKRLGTFLTAAAVLLAFVGSWQYYSDAAYAGNVVHDRLPSTVLYSVIKLFTFAPTVSVGAPTPICYEAAKWIAPLCTGYWIFSAAEAVLRNRFEKLYRRIGRKKQTAVIGFNEESITYIRNGKKDGQDFVLFTESPMEEEQRIRLEREHIPVEDMWELEDAGAADKKKLKRFFSTFSEAVLFSEDSLYNFSVLKNLMDHIESCPEGHDSGTRGFPCLLRCEDRLSEKLITEYCDSKKGRATIDVRLFDISGIAAGELFMREPLYKNCLEILKSDKKVSDPVNTNAGHDDETGMLRWIPDPHVLIAGFGSYGKAVLREVLLTGELSPFSAVKGYERLRITIIDRDARGAKEYIETSYPRMARIGDLEIIDADIGSMEVERRLERLPLPTYTVICFEDTGLSIAALKKLRSFFGLRRRELHGTTEYEACGITVTLAVRAEKGSRELMELLKMERELQDPCMITAFGDMSDILFRNNIADPELEKEAADFNYTYTRLERMMYGGSGKPKEDRTEFVCADNTGENGLNRYEIDSETAEAWEKLRYEKKESNRAQARNRPYIRALLKLLPPLPDKRELLCTDGGTERILRKLEEYPWLDMLTAWEHRRWCNFHYASGYVGFDPDPDKKGSFGKIVGEDGQVYYGKVHNCLIDDWAEMKKDTYAASTIIYDICAIYACENANT